MIKIVADRTPAGWEGAEGEEDVAGDGEAHRGQGAFTVGASRQPAGRRGMMVRDNSRAM